MIRRFTSSPKPSRAGLLVTSRSGRGRLRPEAVPDAVVAGEVRGRLRRGDEVVDGEARTGVRQRDLDDDARPGGSAFSAFSHRRLDLGSPVALVSTPSGTPTRQPLDRPVQTGR